MKKIFIMAMMLTGMVSFAQTKVSASTAETGKVQKQQPQSADEQLKELTAALDLTSAQQTKVKKILQKREEEHASGKRPEKPTGEKPDFNSADTAKAAKGEKREDPLAAEFKEILTDEQYAKYQALEDSKRPKKDTSDNSTKSKNRTKSLSNEN